MPHHPEAVTSSTFTMAATARMTARPEIPNLNIGTVLLGSLNENRHLVTDFEVSTFTHRVNMSLILVPT
jgi:hypothetical protein